MQVNVYLGADYGGKCDHIRVVTEMRVKLKGLRKTKKMEKDWNTKKG